MLQYLAVTLLTRRYTPYFALYGSQYTEIQSVFQLLIAVVCVSHVLQNGDIVGVCAPCVTSTGKVEFCRYTPYH